HETGFDRLAQTDIVCNQQIDTGHIDCSNDGIELIAFARNAAPERRLKKTAIRVSCRAPTHCVQEGLQVYSIVAAGNGRQSCSIQDAATRLQFPDDLELFA